MLQLRPVLFVTGIFLIILSFLMMVPAIVMYTYDETDWVYFLFSSLAAMGTGVLLVITNRLSSFRLWPREAFFLTTVTWLVVSMFAALPLLLIEHIDYSDAFFETMSGITTTGSTVLTNLEHHSHGILIWRSLLQWIGGIGFIVMGIAVLPFLRVGGMRLFRSESSDWSEKVVPRFSTFAKAISLAYLVLTLLNCLGYYLGGMSGFDAINHAMTTISTGGYSTYDDSFGHYQNKTILWVGIVFMLLGAMPFSIYVQFFYRKSKWVWGDQQVSTFLKTVVAVSVLLSLWLWHKNGTDFLDTLTHATFNVVSVITTTGFVSLDYGQWGTVAAVVFFYLMFIGGCSGSTSGSVKIFRYQVAYLILKKQLFQLVHPSAVVSVKYNNREISEDIIWSLVSFSFFFALTVAILAAILAITGLDLTTSLTGAITAVTNVGPGWGPIVGPSGNFAQIADSAKWALSIGMLLGRLEIMTVLVLLAPSFWRG